MRKLPFFFSLIFFFNFSVEAGIIHFKAPSLSGKITAENIQLTDWRAVMSCHYIQNGRPLDSTKYPTTIIKKLEEHTYSINIKAQALFEAAPGIELQNCAYKLIFVGKNKLLHQVSFGEVVLAGTEKHKLNELELNFLQNKDNLAKVLNDRLKDLILIAGPEGGIISKEYREHEEE